MTEKILGLYPQPEDPPETVIVEMDGRYVTVPSKDFWAYSSDAMRTKPLTNEEQGEQ